MVTMTQPNEQQHGSYGGISYTMDAGDMTVTVAYAQLLDWCSSQTRHDSQIGAKVAAGDATVTVLSGETGDYSNSGIGATYAVSDSLTVQAYTGSGEDS